MESNPTDLDPNSNPDADNEARVEAMADAIAARLYWDNLPWRHRFHRNHIQLLAERLVAAGSEPTEEDLAPLQQAERDDNDEARSWVGRRKVIEFFGHHGADLTSQIKLMRCADIVTTAVVSILGLLVLQSISRILWEFLNYLTSLL